MLDRQLLREFEDLSRVQTAPHHGYECLLCRKTVRGRKDLKTHIGRHHADRLDVEALLDRGRLAAAPSHGFWCIVCGVGARRRQELAKHVRRHHRDADVVRQVRFRVESGFLWFRPRPSSRAFSHR